MTREELISRLVECEVHTPGEWHYCGCGKCQIVWAPDRSRMLHDRPNDTDIPTVDTPEGIANARLIALAPALASALREAWAEIDRLKAEVASGDDFRRQIRELHMAKPKESV